MGGWKREGEGGRKGEGVREERGRKRGKRKEEKWRGRRKRRRGRMEEMEQERGRGVVKGQKAKIPSSRTFRFHEMGIREKGKTKE